MKTSITIAIIALATFSQAATNRGCVTFQQGQCRECFQRDVVPGGCSDQKETSIPNCNLLVKQTNGPGQECAACAEGFADKITVNGTKITSTCVQGKIKNCLIEGILPGRNGTEKRVCVACNSADLYSNGDECVSVEKPVPQCFWGGAIKNGKARCVRCINDFAVDAATGKCLDSPQPGCWISQFANTCIACNPFRGFSMDKAGICVKFE